MFPNLNDDYCGICESRGASCGYHNPPPKRYEFLIQFVDGQMEIVSAESVEDAIDMVDRNVRKVFKLVATVQTVQKVTHVS